MNRHYSFEEIYEQNRKRIHYHLHKLNIQDFHQEFFQEGLVALWNAHQTYNPDKGPMSTYFNYTIRYRLIDRIRKLQRQQIQECHTYQALQNGFHHTSKHTSPHEFPAALLQEPAMLELKNRLTRNQWTWLRYTIEGYSTKEIAQIQETTVEAVKSWRKGARKKLQIPRNKKIIKDNILA